MAYQSINPYDGRILKSFKEMNDIQLEAALRVWQVMMRHRALKPADRRTQVYS